MKHSNEFDIKPLIDTYLKAVNQEITLLNRFVILAILGLVMITVVAVNVVI